ncbi:MAG: HAMP domain-containing sensor histidine kinase [Rhizobiaceae bacterium]
MIKRHLHRQIYAAIIASLLLVVLATGVVFSLTQRDGLDRQIYTIIARLTWVALPPATAPYDEQAVALNKLVEGSNLAVSLYDKDKQLIAAYGKAIPSPTDNFKLDGWHRHRGVRGFRPVWVTRLPDQRWLAVNPRSPNDTTPLIKLLLLLFSITLAVGLASYPLVRRLTGRLQRLQSTVDIVGSGDLSTRAKVEGHDEIASLATSFNDATDRIEKLVESNKQLLANASHELRTPLARIRLGAEMLKNKRDPKRQVALEQDISELDGLIDEILLMSRLDNQGSSQKLQSTEQIDLLALVIEECSRYENCSVEGDRAELLGDATLLTRMLRNLLDNAMKHGTPPVLVSITAGSSILLTVTDNGTGIPKAHYDSIFQPFHRAPGKQNVPGYGLGLPLVKQIAEAHGGSVEVLKSRNSTFSIGVTLPRTT